MSCHETDTSMSAWSVGKFAKRSATLHISSEDSKYTEKVCQSSNGAGPLDNLSVLAYTSTRSKTMKASTTTRGGQGGPGTHSRPSRASPACPVRGTAP